MDDLISHLVVWCLRLIGVVDGKSVHRSRACVLLLIWSGAALALGLYSTGFTAVSFYVASTVCGVLALLVACGKFG